MRVANEGHTDMERPPSRRRVIMFVLIGAGLLLFAGANVHLVYVSVNSQPGCVTHAKASGQTPGVYRAAKSAC